MMKSKIYWLSVVALFGAALVWFTIDNIRQPARVIGRADSVVRQPPKPLTYTTDENLLKVAYDPQSLDALIGVLDKADKPPEKSEYETTAAYDKRAASFVPTFDGLAGDTKFVVLVPAEASYNADKSALTIVVGSGFDEPAVEVRRMAGPDRTYKASNAFGVERQVRVSTGSETLLVPLARRQAPKGCNFSSGRPENSPGIYGPYDKRSFIKWACGDGFYGMDGVERMSSFDIPMTADQAKSTGRNIFVAYILRFDRLPNGLVPHFGPALKDHAKATIDNPNESRIVTEALIGRLKRIAIFVPNSKVLLAKSYE